MGPSPRFIFPNTTFSSPPLYVSAAHRPHPTSFPSFHNIVFLCTLSVTAFCSESTIKRIYLDQQIAEWPTQFHKAHRAHTPNAPRIERELCYMGCLWLQCSRGRPLAALTCAVKRCQPWFAIVHLWSPWFGADGLKRPPLGSSRLSSI